MAAQERGASSPRERRSRRRAAGYGRCAVLAVWPCGRYAVCPGQPGALPLRGCTGDMRGQRGLVLPQPRFPEVRRLREAAVCCPGEGACVASMPGKEKLVRLPLGTLLSGNSRFSGPASSESRLPLKGSPGSAKSTASAGSAGAGEVALPGNSKLGCGAAESASIGAGVGNGVCGTFGAPDSLSATA